MYIFDGSSWKQILAPVQVLSLKSYNGKLYVAGSTGKVYTYDGSSWSSEPVLNIDEPYSTEYLRMLGNYSNRLYAASYLDYPALLYYCDGSCDNPSNWHQDLAFNNTLICPAPFCSIDSMEVYNGKMYLSSGGTIYRYDGSWNVQKQYDDASFSDMKVFNGRLYLATRDGSTRCPMDAGGSGFCGRVIEYDGTNWKTVFDHDYWIYSLGVYHNRLYAGTANKIYMSSDANNWQLTFNSLEGAQYALALKTWNDKIYVGFGNGVMFKDDLLEITTTTTTTSTITSTTTVKTTTSTVKPTTTTTKSTTTIISSCTCTAWKPTYICCTGGKGKWTRTCTPKACQVETKCEGPCIV
jgi:hypothetical protein